MQTRKTRWAVYNLNYHLVWIPKYRKSVLIGEVRDELEKLIKDVAKKHKIEIKSLSIQSDHVHLFVSAPPRLAPAKIVNLFKGITSKKLLEKFPKLRTQEGFWSRTYYIGSVGAVSEESIRRYIEECQDMR